MNEDCPCRFCKPPERSATCHATCPKWKDWKPVQMKRAYDIWQKRRKENMINTYTAKDVEHNKTSAAKAIGNRKWKDAHKSRMENNQEGSTDRPNGPHSDGNV